MEQSYDTIADAAATPDQQMPFAELGLKPEEYERIFGFKPIRYPVTPSDGARVL